MKRIITGSLAAMIALTTLASCSSDAKVTETSETKATYDSSKASWEQDKSDIELEWFIAYDWVDVNFDAENSLFDKYIYDNTGVKIKYSIGSQEKLSALMATDTLPDIVTYDANSPERLSLEDAGQLLPLDELRENFAPDFQVSEAQMDWYANEKDGHWYGLVSYFYDMDDTYERGGYIESHNMNFARQDIMNDLGIDPESMNTKDGFIAALQTVKDADISYNGQKVIPYLGNNVAHLAEQFGLDREDADGNLLNEMRQSEYLEALLFLNEIYNKGLTTDEVFTMDSTLRRQLVSSGGIFAGTTQAFLAGKDVLFFNDADALMQGVGLIEGDSKKDAIISPSPMGGWTATMISKNTKSPERAISLLAFLSQPEVSLSYYYGGIDGYDVVDGKAIVKADRAAERSADSAAFDAKYRSYIQEFVNDFVWVKAYEPVDGMDALNVDLLKYTEEWVNGNIYDDKIFTSVQPESGSDMTAIAAQLTAYWEQQYPLIVMAATEEEAITIYEESIAQMDTMGMESLDEYKNERFQANKAKVGVEFAWPRNN